MMLMRGISSGALRSQNGVEQMIQLAVDAARRAEMEFYTKLTALCRVAPMEISTRGADDFTVSLL